MEEPDSGSRRPRNARVPVAVAVAIVVAVVVLCTGIAVARRHGGTAEGTQTGAGESASPVAMAPASSGTADVAGEATTAASDAASPADGTAGATATLSAAGGRVVCLDPGHQDSEDLSTEPIGPGSTTMKTKMTLGTHGTTTGVPEYEMTLAVGRALRAELESRGYTVRMTRESSDVNLSNVDRAQYCASVDADVYIRLHGDGVDAASADGATMLAPSPSNPYLPREVIERSRTLAQDIIDAYCAATGMRNRGVRDSDDMTGMNWATMPVTLIELGFMTNPTDDTNMEDPAYQAKMASGIADGVDAYFAR